MENCLRRTPNINLVYTINEPAAFGAYTAHQERRARRRTSPIVSVDGGCQGVQGVVDGKIAATSQQYPLKMASLGVEALVNFAKTARRPSGYTDTGVTLITDKAADRRRQQGLRRSAWQTAGATSKAPDCRSGGAHAPPLPRIEEDDP